MSMIVLFLVLAARISMCSDTPYGKLVSPDDSTAMYIWFGFLTYKKFPALEAKFIIPDPQNDYGTQVCGSVFTVDESDFWKAFLGTAEKSWNKGGPTYNCSFNKSLKETLLKAPGGKIEGLSPLFKDLIKYFLSNDPAITWNVGPVGYSLWHRIPGSIELYPGGDYALHFIPKSAPQSVRDMFTSVQQQKSQDSIMIMTMMGGVLKELAEIKETLKHLTQEKVDVSTQTLPSQDDDARDFDDERV